MVAMKTVSTVKTVMIRTVSTTLASLGLLAAAPGCGVAPPVATTASSNGAVDVDELFTHDGCTVYRFSDVRSSLVGDNYHYYVRCRDLPASSPPQASTFSTRSCGKTCRREEDIPTWVDGARGT